MGIIDDERAQALANAIVLQACADYRSSMKYLKTHKKTPELVAKVEAMSPDDRKKSPENKLLNTIIKHESVIDDVERFFHSRWYECLTDVSGEYVLQKLKEEFADEC